MENQKPPARVVAIHQILAILRLPRADMTKPALENTQKMAEELNISASELLEHARHGTAQ